MHVQKQNSMVQLRPATADDYVDLLNIYSSTREDELALTPWNDEQRRAFLEMQLKAQQSHYLEKYPGADHDMILLEGEIIGRIYVARLDGEIRIVDITLLPAYRGSGIGTELLQQLISEAERAQKPLRIYVESFNRSLELFKRLGFSCSGEHGIHLLMQRSPGAESAPA